MTSYVALVERPTGTKHRFFSNPRAKKESPNTIALAEAWVTEQLQKEGTHNVRVSISQVLWSIEG